ncbi:SIR2 family protein [uncultured Aliiroseovarius sp.]|uniref:SIR2 family protein n=1 Tax=uncultured Aliiroseovarius sp. TaxID=1658783 RepID=UPI00260514EB|nr:SIR2 family protein [uncultured Aliiroseovarius sp.]
MKEIELQPELEETIVDVLSGSAVLFVGAGFSLGAKDSFSKDVPSTEELTQEIRELAGISDSEGGNLSDLAEFCENEPALHSELVNLLSERLTGCQPNEHHKKLLALPWRSVFTTNFDDVAETVLKGKDTQVITPKTLSEHIIPSKTPLYYLHGRALDLSEGHADPKFVLSETNYIDLPKENKELYSALENEISVARRVVFLGYSLRDAEIASRLFRVEGFAQRASVITRKDQSQISRNRLRKFGEVFEIGLKGFQEEVDAYEVGFDKGEATRSLGFISRQEPSVPSDGVAAEEVESLLMAGRFSAATYSAHTADRLGENPYCVTRSKKLSDVFETQTKTNRFVVTSNLGNGKTVFCHQIAAEGLSRGFDVVRVETNLQEQFGDLDQLLVDNMKRVYIVDDYPRYQKFANYIGKRLPGNGILIVTIRQDLDQVGFAQMAKYLGGTIKEIDLDELDADELESWDNLLERWGFWGERIKNSSSERVTFLKKECGAENRSVLVSIFKGSAIAQRIHETVGFFVNSNPNEKKAFIAVLINAMCQNHVDWSRIVRWLSIDESSFRRAVLASPIAALTGGTRRWYEFSSATLADFILNNFEFDVDLVVSVYTDIVKHTATSSADRRSGSDAVENLKELMKFRFLTRLFASNKNSEEIISAVYNRLSRVPKIRDHDQFYLQYAMARMEVGDLEAAERYLNTAIGLVEKKGGGYGLRQIHDQRIRLIFQKYSQPKSVLNKAQIYEAIDDLRAALKASNEFVIYPLRSAQHISNFLDIRIDEIDVTLRSALETVIDEMLEIVKSTSRLERSQKGETRRIVKSIRDCKLVIANA